MWIAIWMTKNKTYDERGSLDGSHLCHVFFMWNLQLPFWFFCLYILLSSLSSFLKVFTGSQKLPKFISRKDLLTWWQCITKESLVQIYKNGLRYILKSYFLFLSLYDFTTYLTYIWTSMTKSYQGFIHRGDRCDQGHT